MQPLTTPANYRILDCRFAEDAPFVESMNANEAAQREARQALGIPHDYTTGFHQPFTCEWHRDLRQDAATLDEFIRSVDARLQKAGFKDALIVVYNFAVSSQASCLDLPAKANSVF